MDTSAKAIANRREKYEKITKVADSLGRVIGFRPLKPSEAVRVREMAPALDGMETVVDEATGRRFEIPKAMPLTIAASVREIDGHPFAFPRSRGELDAVLDLLDDEGMLAIMMGLTEAGRKKEEDAAAAAEVGVEAAKNSAETPA